MGESEFFFQEDSLDPNVIIGSNFQVLAKAGDNSLEPVGDKFTISNGDLSNGSMVLNAPKTDFENISGVYSTRITKCLYERPFPRLGTRLSIKI